jgi:hypothetical protein
MASFLAAGDATHADLTLEGSYLQVLTHVAVAVAFVFFVLWREWYAASISLSTFFISNMYHICKAGWYCFGMVATSVLNVSALERLRLLDHANSNHTSAAVFLILAFSDTGGGTHAIAYRLLLPFVSMFAVFAFPYEAKSAVVVVAYVLLVIAFEYLWVRGGRLPSPARFKLLYAGLAVPAAAVAFFFYFEPSFIPREISHALWHVFIFITLVLAVRAGNHTGVKLCPCVGRSEEEVTL